MPLLEWIDRDTKEVRAIPESLVVSDYLDALYPENRLQPDDPYLKSKHQVLVGRFGSVSRNSSKDSRSFQCIFFVGTICIL